ncbi:hypothetical protein [Thaumasiovibrio subtropicus]|uniref:hypothetical protein n=1 Tax=Thaumasiovibrio subtropicus TaxID=1891207 RepID=UPI000B34AB4E|nr:hypothetical protein [Thaumasiovibrio subtropicus]
MNFTHIRASAKDLNVHLNAMRPAYDGSDSPKLEFDLLREWVEGQHASFYKVTGKGVSLRFVGRFEESTYHIIAMTGKGLGIAAPFIIDRIRECGYDAIQYHTYRKGMRRILNRFGFAEAQTLRKFDGKRETVHRLVLGSKHG